MKIILVGAGRQLYYLSRDFLSKGHSVVLVCGDGNDARWLARRLKATVLHADGSLPSVLEDAGAREADAVVAVTPRDPDNFVICQIAKHAFGVPSTLAVVSDPDNQEVFSRLGVKNVVSITQLISRVIEQRTGAEEIRDLAIMAEGAVNVTELVLPDASPAVGKSLAALNLPREALIASVVRDSAAIIPRGDTVLAVGDRVVLVTLPASHGRAVKFLTGET